MSITSSFTLVGILVAAWCAVSKATCDIGKWGTDCQQQCAEGCLFDIGCDAISGVCNTCNKGFYGPRCDSKCTENCQTCYEDTGLCKKCENTWYGELCDKRCPANCYGCDINSGKCSHCNNGYWGENCENDCQTNTACVRNCVSERSSSLCENACKCTFCTKSDGICKQCSVGFWGNSCDRACPEHCITDCYFESGACKSFTDQINGVSLYCKDGYWGSKCQYSCQPQNCSRCDQSGQCIQCKDGYWGEFCHNKCDYCSSCDVSYGYCVKCKHGVWGYKCNQRCANGCPCCNIRSGICDMSACQLENIDIKDGNNSNVTRQDPEDKTVSAISIVGIAALVVGCILCAVSVTMMLCLIRRRKDDNPETRELETTNVNDGYLRPVNRLDTRKTSTVYDRPDY